MAEIVYDAHGSPFELRSRATAVSGMRRSVREAMEHARSVSSVLDDDRNRDAMIRALVGLGACRPDEIAGVPFEEVRARTKDALSSGGLVLVPHVADRRLMATNYDPPPERLRDLTVDEEPEVRPTHTLELHLEDANGEPVAGEPFRVELPGGEIREGRLDARGVALLTGLVDAGTCRVNFPQWDKDCWKPA